MGQADVKLLLVDDDPAAVRAMSRILAEYPNQRFATSGAEALRMAREERPDLVVLDAEMPGMTGLDVCDAFQLDPTLAQVPVIFATAHQSPLLEAAALNRGAVDFVTKPPVAEQVRARVRAHLRMRLDAGAVSAADLPPVGPEHLPRLLIVDDDVTAVRLLRHALAQMGEFRFAKSGEEGLALARTFDPDLILLDAHMPEFDGFDLCRALKADPALAAVPVMFVTRFGDPRNEQRAFDLGAADFIVKPYAPIVARARVKNLLERKRRQDDERRALRDRWLRVSADLVATIVRAASDAIVSHDVAGQVVLANAAACRLFDAPAGHLVGQPIEALMGSSWSGPAAGECSTLTLQRGAAAIELEVAVSSVGAGEECLTTLILRDVSDRERLERETRARIDAEAVSRTKSLMLSSIAHEVGNPLNGILGFAQLMAGDTAHPLPPAQAARLGHLTASAWHLQALMRDLSDLGALESGRLAVSLQRVALAPCLHDAVGATGGLAAEAGVSVSVAEVDPALAVRADAVRLHQCLLNLLSNAVKYNRAGGSARVDVAVRDAEVAVAVRDDGLGMDATQREHLFEPFNRLGRHGTTRGSGLGLVVTRQLVRAMHGRLEVDSEAGRGSVFTIVLPRALERDEPATGHVTAPVALEP